MNVIRLVTVAAASSALLTAAAPSAHALGLEGPLGTTAKAAGVATKYAVPVAENAVGDKVGEKVGALQNTLKAGTDAVAGVNQLMN
jgi:hypothetical protein